MTPSLTTIEATEPLEKIIEIIERDGGVIVSNFLTPDLLGECMETSQYLHKSMCGWELIFCSLVEPHFNNRKIYDSKATHDELGADFFPDGSQRVYVSDVNAKSCFQQLIGGDSRC